MAVRFVLSIAGIFYRALQLLPFANKIFYCDSGRTPAAVFFSSMGSTFSTTHRLKMRRALYFRHSDNKMVSLCSLRQ